MQASDIKVGTVIRRRGELEVTWTVILRAGDIDDLVVRSEGPSGTHVFHFTVSVEEFLKECAD